MTGDELAGALVTACDDIGIRLEREQIDELAHRTAELFEQARRNERTSVCDATLDALGLVHLAARDGSTLASPGEFAALVGAVESPGHWRMAASLLADWLVPLLGREPGGVDAWESARRAEALRPPTDTGGAS